MAKPGPPAKPRDLWLAKDPFLEVLQGAMALGTNRAWAAAAVMALMGAAGCGEDEASRNPASFTTPTVPAHLEQPEEALPRPIAVEAGEGRPARRFSTDAFEPRFSILLPPRWMATERGQGAWQAWIGDDERASPGELTFDMALAGTPVVEAVRRLRATPGLGAAPARTARVAGGAGLTFDAQPTRAGELPESGYRFGPGEHLRVSVVRRVGRTVTVIVTVSVPAAVRPFLAQVERVLDTVRFPD